MGKWRKKNEGWRRRGYNFEPVDGVFSGYDAGLSNVSLPLCSFCFLSKKKERKKKAGAIFYGERDYNICV